MVSYKGTNFHSHYATGLGISVHWLQVARLKGSYKYSQHFCKCETARKVKRKREAGWTLTYLNKYIRISFIQRQNKEGIINDQDLFIYLFFTKQKKKKDKLSDWRPVDATWYVFVECSTSKRELHCFSRLFLPLTNDASQKKCSVWSSGDVWTIRDSNSGVSRFADWRKKRNKALWLISFAPLKTPVRNKKAFRLH